MIEQIYSFLKKPKVLPVVVLFLLIVVTQLRWNYVGTRSYGRGAVTYAYKVDRFTGFKYVDVFSRSNYTKGGTYPAYSYKEQTGLYNMAKTTDEIETAVINTLFATNFVWLLFVYIVKPFRDAMKSFKDKHKQ
jgi:hypothetical protein